MEKITIMLVDDHRLIRDTWAFILNSDPRFTIVAETDNGMEAIRMAQEKKPRIVLMDINMTPVSGFEATQKICKSSPGSKVIAVTMHSIPVFAKKILRLGAMGYITKNSSKEEMMSAIVEVNNGGKYICTEIKDIIGQQEIDPDPDGMCTLTQQETNIIHLIKEGLSSREIAAQLNIASKTVEVHRYNILKKLKLANTASLVNYIYTQNL